MIRDIVNVLSISWARNTARKLVGNILNVLMMYQLGFSGYIVHVLTMYLQCPGLGNWGLPPVGGVPNEEDVGEAFCCPCISSA